MRVLTIPEITQEDLKALVINTPWRNERLRRAALMLAAMHLLCAAVSPVMANAQVVQPLVQFTHVWKYDQSGQELGTDWRANTYDDSPWPSGPGLLGFEATPFPYQVHAQVSTPLTVSATVTSYYFRTTFVFDGTTNGLSLIASNLVDDGCVIYLNGMQVGGVRAPAVYNATTLFQGPATEGALDVVTFTNLTALRVGTNLLAVEVHQNVVASADIMWGMVLMAVWHTPLAMVKAPEDQIAMVGDRVIFSTEVSGGPAFFQWQKDGVNIGNARGSNYTNGSVTLGAAGEYRVIVTNSVSSLTSGVARLSVFADTVGPQLVSAIADYGFGSNSIIVGFSEPLRTFSAITASNYSVKSLDSGKTVPVTNAAYALSFEGRPSVLLRVQSANNPDWIRFGNYIVIVNRVTDDDGNVIAPNSQIAVAWPRQSDLVAPDAAWDFHAAAAFDPEVFNEDWMAPGYVGSFWWAQGSGVFYSGRPSQGAACLGDLQTAIGIQSEPSLFRTAFLWPESSGSAAVLEINAAVDDGMIMYLNGAEIWRTNLPPPPASLTAFSRSITPLTTPLCLSNRVSVANLVPGLNWIAAGVVQSASSDVDTLFGLRLKATTYLPGLLPENPIPVLNVSLSEGALRLSWASAGYALESCTNLTDNSASYPFGPWQEVPGMANPYTSLFTNPQRFYRLKKK